MQELRGGPRRLGSFITRVTQTWKKGKFIEKIPNNSEVKEEQ